jgi:light-harvesting complex I chlorophyll a/b binding protein 1
MVYHHHASASVGAFQVPFLPQAIYQTPVAQEIPIAVPPIFEKKRPYCRATVSCLAFCNRADTRTSRRRSIAHLIRLRATSSKSSPGKDEENEEGRVEEGDKEFLKKELARVESLEEILDELEAYGGIADGEDDLDEADAYFFDDWDEETLEELFLSLPEEDNEEEDETYLDLGKKSWIRRQSASLLENALLQGVVPANAGVGSSSLPGDFGFDPLELSKKDYFRQAQNYLINLVPVKEDKYGELPEQESNDISSEGERPQALILRDYREAEIRHGRLAMLAATFWPLQELLDRLVLDEDQTDSLIHSLFFGGVTLPYFPLLMTAIMLLLGYLDIYSKAIKDMDKIGEAFLPGDCFWDPLQMLTAAPDQMKRNMQERELFNGRFAMIAIAVFIWEEVVTGKPVVSVPGNELLFEPAYTIPFIQQWLDDQFSTGSPVFYHFSEEDEAAESVIFSLDLLLQYLGGSFQLI